MSQNKEHSLVATLKTNYGNLHLSELTYGKPFHTKQLDDDPWSVDATMSTSHTAHLRINQGWSPPDHTRQNLCRQSRCGSMSPAGSFS
ncbi:hypothetical protein [Pseudomonas sp. C2B4]|uniref:hypothetical protein n=1 Tax=Pseudomonas sp. C2B4 TaxID=2735270 RepID=UPI001586EBA7|nr:hypothetical protein [Pseudomonas sp. C2B4]NUU38627.1 hypothetical protein [Pseudomonas sp. C2B4]